MNPSGTGHPESRYPSASGYREPRMYKSHLDYAWVGIPQSPPFRRMTTATATLLAAHHRSTPPPPSPPPPPPPGGSNLAWRSGLNDRPHSERAALVHETLNFQGRNENAARRSTKILLRGGRPRRRLRDRRGYSMPCYYKRLRLYFHIARLDEV